MKKRYFFLPILLLSLLNACGSDDPATTTGTLNGLSTSVAAVKTKVAKASVFGSASADDITASAAADWTDNTVLDTIGDSTCTATNTPKGLLTSMTSSTCTISPMFDLNNMLDMMCVLTNELTLTNGLPSAGTYSITVSASTASLCGVSDASGANITATVTDTASQTTYQRLISFAVNGDRQIFFGTSGTTTNIAFTYTEGTTSAYRGYYTTDTGTNLTRFELQSSSTQGTANSTLFRVLIDESESPGEVLALGSRNDQGNAGEFTRWSYTAPLNASDQYGVAMAWGGHAAGGGTSPLQTCVNPATSYSASGTTSSNCGTEGYTARTITDVSTLAQNAFTAITGITLSVFVNEVGDSDVITWTDANMATQAIIQ